MAAPRVAVVGAGFAGLAAADALASAGAEVVVLEARDRVGGRVWSRELENGAVVEMGAEFILPASVLDRITFEPPLPESLRSAYAAVGYGNAAKLFVPLGETPATSAVLSVPERYWTWTATAADGVQSVVHAFAGSAPALTRLRVTDGPTTWLASLATLRPDLALLPDEAVFMDWGADPWVGGAYSCDRPATSAWAPAGPFHACGEHTCDGNAALMDGALASGLRVADEILQAAESGIRYAPEHVS